MLRLNDPLLPLLATEAALEIGRLRVGTVDCGELSAVALIAKKLAETLQPGNHGSLAFLAPSMPPTGLSGSDLQSDDWSDEDYVLMTDRLREIGEKASGAQLPEAEAFCWRLAHRADSELAFERRLEESLWLGEAEHAGT